MAHSRDEVVTAVQKTFPENVHTRVLEMLDTYGVESYERERERVQLAILKLSERNEEKLREFEARLSGRAFLGGESGGSAIGYAGKTRTNKENVREVRDQAAGGGADRHGRGAKNFDPKWHRENWCSQKFQPGREMIEPAGFGAGEKRERDNAHCFLGVIRSVTVRHPGRAHDLRFTKKLMNE